MLEKHEPQANASRTSRVIKKIPSAYITQQCTRNKFFISFITGGGGGGGARDEVWDRETIFSQLAKAVNPRASQRPSKAAVRFPMISTLALSFE